MESKKITDYFSTRKRTSHHASKRRKIERPTTRTRGQVDPKAKSIVSALTTSAWDEHNGPVTPSKTSVPGSGSGRKRSRKTANKMDQVEEESTPEKRMQLEKRSPVQARKKLQMKATVEVKDKVEADTTPPAIIQPTQVSQPTPVSQSAQVPQSTPVSPATSGRTSATPAYERFRKLATPTAIIKPTRVAPSTPVSPPTPVSQSTTVSQPIPESQSTPVSLSVPQKYRLLEEQFHGLDLVMKLRLNQRTTISKLRRAVCAATNKELDLKQVGQIKTVYPTAYTLRQEKLPDSGPGYHLTIEANLEDTDQAASEKTLQFKPHHLAARRARFHAGLIRIVKHHHKEFLGKLSCSLSVPDSKIRRWHPKFCLDDVPDVEMAALPEPPVIPRAADLLAKHVLTLTPRVKAALEKTAQEFSPKSTPSSGRRTTSSVVSSPALKGVELSLLERIRAKEASKAMAAITQDSAEVKRNGMLQRLPDMMRILRGAFINEKRPALPLETMIQRVHGSLKNSIPAGDVESHLNLCMELMPQWLSTVTVRKVKYLKLDRNIELQPLIDKVSGMIKQKQ